MTIIFEDNFNWYSGSPWTPSISGAGHHVAGGTLQSPGLKEPHNWTGWIRYGTAALSIQPGAGRNGTSALKITPEWPSSASNQVGLCKWLGPTGYDELYFRYWMKFDDAYRWGNGVNNSFVYHKVFRLWQNVGASEVAGQSGNLGSELARGAMVGGYYDDQWSTFGPCFYLTCMVNATAGTNNCPSDQTCETYYYNPYSTLDTKGFLNPFIGELDANGRSESPTQDWFCVEMHVKLASTFNGSDGIFEIWVNGIKQDPFNWVSVPSPSYAGVPRAGDTMPTGILGTGINYITLNDNQTGTNSWTQGYSYYYDDFVVSTEYIGPDYTVGGGATPPTNSITTTDNQTVSSPSFTIQGNATAQIASYITSVTCPNQTVTSDDSTFDEQIEVWTCNVTLQVGLNQFTFTATDNNGLTGTDTISVTYQPPQSPTNTFTVDNNQTVGSASFTITGRATAPTGQTITAVTCPTATITAVNAPFNSLEEDWTASVTLVPGVNFFQITATCSNGQDIKDNFYVTYIEPQSTIKNTGLIITGGRFK